MSTNGDARQNAGNPGIKSRRTFLAAGTAALAGGASLGMVAAATAGTDPVFALLAAEQVAWDAYDRAIGIEQAAEGAVKAAGVDRPACVQTGITTTMVADDGRPLSEGERTESAVYAYSREEIRRAYAGRDDTVWMEIGGHRIARIGTERRKTLAEALAAFEADERAIETAPETLAYLAAEKARSEACDAHDAALLALVSAVPTTSAGLLAMLDRFGEREADSISDVVGIPELLASVRSFMAGRA